MAYPPCWRHSRESRNNYLKHIDRLIFRAANWSGCTINGQLHQKKTLKCGVKGQKALKSPGRQAFMPGRSLFLRSIDGSWNARCSGGKAFTYSEWHEPTRKQGRTT